MKINPESLVELAAAIDVGGMKANQRQINRWTSQAVRQVDANLEELQLMIGDLRTELEAVKVRGLGS